MNERRWISVCSCSVSVIRDVFVFVYSMISWCICVFVNGWGYLCGCVFVCSELCFLDWNDGFSKGKDMVFEGEVW